MTQTCKGDCTKEIQQDVERLGVILWTEDRGGAVSRHPDHLNHEKVRYVFLSEILVWSESLCNFCPVYTKVHSATVHCIVQ